jgi:NADPH-dependent 2,4-dienoyl-CoA reductase/sulfur reductase-like enzyme
MEAALRLVARGHEAVLFETSNRLGGAFRAAARVYEPNQDYLAWLEREIAASGVDLRLGVEATPESLSVLGPDVVIVASGGFPNDHAVPDAETFLTDLPAAFDGAGSSFVILGGGMIGLELAQFLRGRGAEVAVFDPAPKLGAGLPIVRRARVLAELREAGVALHAATQMFKAPDRMMPVVAIPPRPDTTLAESLGAAGFTVITAGDCAGHNTLEESIRAVWDAVDTI